MRHPRHEIAMFDRRRVRIEARPAKLRPIRLRRHQDEPGMAERQRIRRHAPPGSALYNSSTATPFLRGERAKGIEPFGMIAPETSRMQVVDFQRVNFQPCLSRSLDSRKICQIFVRFFHHPAHFLHLALNNRTCGSARLSKLNARRIAACQRRVVS
jgi:hypothetical protein